jgi:phage head maturation protease
LSNAQRSEPIPILRSFESEGEKYVYGYTAIFDSEDSYGTAMTRDAVESSLPHLRSFPAVRFMHKVPFGQIVFNQEVEGAKTFVDDHGFHVLCRVYDQCENEWGMVKAGKWGFSYGFMPDAEGGVQTRKLANGHTVPAFVKGIMYEVSVVDTPSHSDAVAYVVSRMIEPNEEPIPQRKEGFIGMVESAFSHSETRAVDNNKLSNLLDRLTTIEKAVLDAENSVKSNHIIPNSPRFCKPKNPDGSEE